MSESKKNAKVDEVVVEAQEPLTDIEIPTKEELEVADYRSHFPIFCFKHLNHDDKHFHLDKLQGAQPFKQLLKKLKHYSGMKWGVIETTRQYHAHEIPWHESCKKNGFPSECSGFPAYQFAINDRFRVVGYHFRNVFHIVWLDPNHNFCKTH